MIVELMSIIKERMSGLDYFSDSNSNSERKEPYELCDHFVTKLDTFLRRVMRIGFS